MTARRAARRNDIGVALLGILLVLSALATPSGALAIGTRAIARCVPSARLVCLGNAASGRVTSIHRGAFVQVTLGGADLEWSAITHPAPSVLRPASAPIRSNGESRATFVAARDGRTTLRATATSKCSPGLACPQFVLLWQATIAITS